MGSERIVTREVIVAAETREHGIVGGEDQPAVSDEAQQGVPPRSEEPTGPDEPVAGAAAAGVAGAVIGVMAGGPVGAVLGGAIGAAAGATTGEVDERRRRELKAVGSALDADEPEPESGPADSGPPANDMTFPSDAPPEVAPRSRDADA